MQSGSRFSNPARSSATRLAPPPAASALLITATRSLFRLLRAMTCQAPPIVWDLSLDARRALRRPDRGSLPRTLANRRAEDSPGTLRRTYDALHVGFVSHRQQIQ